MPLSRQRYANSACGCVGRRVSTSGLLPAQESAELGINLNERRGSSDAYVAGMIAPFELIRITAVIPPLPS
jgi:hypothetical protein